MRVQAQTYILLQCFAKVTRQAGKTGNRCMRKRASLWVISGDILLLWVWCYPSFWAPHLEGIEWQSAISFHSFPAQAAGAAAYWRRPQSRKQTSSGIFVCFWPSKARQLPALCLGKAVISTGPARQCCWNVKFTRPFEHTANDFFGALNPTYQSSNKANWREKASRKCSAIYFVSKEEATKL